MLGRLVHVYDILFRVFSRNREEHLGHVRTVLEPLRHHKLYAKASKYRFCSICCSSFGFRSSFGFHVISARRAAVGPRKVAAAEWATRTSALACAASLATKIANLSYPIWPAVLMQVSNAGFCTRR